MSEFAVSDVRDTVRTCPSETVCECVASVLREIDFSSNSNLKQKKVEEQLGNGIPASGEKINCITDMLWKRYGASRCMHNSIKRIHDDLYAEWDTSARHKTEMHVRDGCCQTVIRCAPHLSPLSLSLFTVDSRIATAKAFYFSFHFVAVSNGSMMPAKSVQCNLFFVCESLSHSTRRRWLHGKLCATACSKRRCAIVYRQTIGRP